jgi:hypothetical protein
VSERTSSPLAAIQYKWSRRLNEIVLIEQRALLMEAGLRNLVRKLETIAFPSRADLEPEISAAYDLLGEIDGKRN